LAGTAGSSLFFAVAGKPEILLILASGMLAVAFAVMENRK
jgi:hypothetical protein